MRKMPLRKRGTARQALPDHPGPLKIVADAGYSNGEQARACEAQGIEVHVPANRAVNSQGDGTLLDRRAFVYDATADRYTCPAGRPLERKQQSRRDRAVTYAADASTCSPCALKQQCTLAPRRFITRHFDDDVLKRMHQRATPAAMRIRRCRPVFLSRFALPSGWSWPNQKCDVVHRKAGVVSLHCPARSGELNATGRLFE